MCTHSSKHEGRLLVCATIAQAAEYENKATSSNQNPGRLLDHSGLRKLLDTKRTQKQALKAFYALQKISGLIEKMNALYIWIIKMMIKVHV